MVRQSYPLIVERKSLTIMARKMDIPGVMDDVCGIMIQNIIEKYKAPKEVLESKVSDIKPDPPLACCFADSSKKLPIHTKAASWISAAWIVDNDIHDDAIIRTVKNALRQFNMPYEWDRLVKIKNQIDKQNDMNKSASISNLIKSGIHKYALPDKLSYPIHTPRLLAKACVYFDKNPDDLTAEEKIKYATNCIENFDKFASHWYDVLNQSNLDGLDNEYIRQRCIREDKTFFKVAEQIYNKLEIYAGRFLPDWDRWYENVVEKREKLAKYAGDQKVEDIIRAYKIENPVTGDIEGMIKYADDMSKLDRMYFKYPVNDPIFAIAISTQSQAQKMMEGIVKSAHSGAYYKLEDLRKIPPSIWSANLGTNPLIISDAKIKELMSDPIKAASCEKMLAYNGVYPISGESSTYRVLRLFA